MVSNSFGAVTSAVATLQFVFPKSDFDRNTYSDVLWQHDNGSVALWLMTNVNRRESIILNPQQPIPDGWRIAGQGGWSRDGNADILWQHRNGQIAVWFMNHTNFLRSQFLREAAPVRTGWRIVGANDFNHDLQSDILFQHDDGKLALWLMAQTNIISATFLRGGLPAGNGWRAVGAADINGDSESDILFQHNNSRALAVWLMDETQFIHLEWLRNGTPVGIGWRVAGMCDWDLDGHVDLLFQHNDGRSAAWLMEGKNVRVARLLNHGWPMAPGWQLLGPR